jgi:HEAT repeat protein
MDDTIAQLKTESLFKHFPEDHLRKLLTDDPDWPERFRALHRQHERERAEARRRRLAALAPLFADLDAASLLERDEDAPWGYLPQGYIAAAYPLLLKWYPRIDTVLAREWMASHLDTPPAAAWVPELIALYRQFRLTEPANSTWKLGNAIGTYMTRDHIEEALDLAADTGFGEDRFAIVRQLWKFKTDPRVLPLATRLALQPDHGAIKREALYVLRRIADPSSRPLFEQHLDDPDTDVRRIAREGIAKLDKQRARTT